MIFRNERLKKRGRKWNGTYSDGVEGQDAAVFEFPRHDFCAVRAHCQPNTFVLFLPKEM